VYLQILCTYQYLSSICKLAKLPKLAINYLLDANQALIIIPCGAGENQERLQTFLKSSVLANHPFKYFFVIGFDSARDS
jgi:hypothetical protein